MWALAWDWKSWLAYGVGVLLFFGCARLLLAPLKFAVRLIASAAVGAALLALFNLAGGYFGAALPLNPVTAVVSGLLGLPGVALLVALKYFVFG